MKCRGLTQKENSFITHKIQIILFSAIFDYREPGPYSVDGPEGSVYSRKPSDTDSVMTSASDMASLRSYRKLTDDGNTVIYSSDTNENKGGKHISNGTNGYNFNSVNERQNKSVVTNGYDSHHETDGLKTSSNSRVTKKQLSQQKSPSPGTPKDAQATSWLFKDKNVTVKPKDSSTLGPSGGEKVKEKQLVDMDSTDTEVDEKKDSVMVYLDKSFKTMGNHILKFTLCVILGKKLITSLYSWSSVYGNIFKQSKMC